MASGHWQATTPKDNRGEQGGGQNPALPAALRAARPRGARTARWLEVATGSHSHLRRKYRQRRGRGGGGYPRRGFLGTLFTGGTPDSIGNGKIPVSLGFTNAEDLSGGSHLVLRWVGLLLGEPLREDSFTVRAVWKQPESSMGKGMEWGAQQTSWSPWTTVSRAGSVQDSAPRNDPVTHPQTQASILPSWEPTGAGHCSKRVQATKEPGLQFHFTDEETKTHRG